MYVPGMLYDAVAHLGLHSISAGSVLGVTVAFSTAIVHCIVQNAMFVSVFFFQAEHLRFRSTCRLQCH